MIGYLCDRYCYLINSTQLKDRMGRDGIGSQKKMTLLMPGTGERGWQQDHGKKGAQQWGFGHMLLIQLPVGVLGILVLFLHFGYPTKRLCSLLLLC